MKDSLKDKIIIHLRTAKTYSALSHTIGSYFYKLQSKQQLWLAKKLIRKYNKTQDNTLTLFFKKGA